MTRDEFIVKRLRSEAKVRRVTVPIMGACVVAAVVMTIVALIMGKGLMSFGPTLIMACIAMSIPLFVNEAKEYEAAAKELEAHMADPSVPLSKNAQLEINHLSANGVKELRQQTVAYSLLAILLLGMGALLVALIGDSAYAFVGWLMLAGGALLAVMTIKNLRMAWLARDIERMDA